ncbi:uncharacterized protein C8Q71DRAFT_184383 [Rhodofomes roseus]|uniref:COI1 F-box domain-containing protein n=1 Tax=Rhodofomes roseus TaxID=34475 RepID=A0ABQ8K840_9APHY|nr:uncharacterized protein C8Q71DRAFT_184383 [Rhodofomes roseus]KAH9833461.1 hypothetical protein C8Q71DRAFT_184383 [Rhodofomes roseus]
MEHPRQIAVLPAHEHHEPVAEFDWDAYYWAPVPSKHIPFPLPLSLSTRISLDILYYVLENLDSEMDRSSITLVCKEWYRCFGSIRYSDLCIRDREGLHSLLAQYARCERVRRRFRSTTTLRIQQRDGSLESFCDTVPLVLGMRMPAVHTLVFHGCIRPSMHPTFAKGLRLFKSIRCLELSTFILGSLGGLYRILVGCPLLEALILRDGEYRWPYPAQTAAPSRTPSQNVHLPELRRLELRNLEIYLFDSLVDWLARTACCEHITHLTISEFAGVGAQLSTRLLEAIGPSLEQLCLVDIPMRPYLHADDNAPNLGSNSNITQVDVEIEAVSDIESFRRLVTSMDGHTDDRMRFVRSWWPILSTVPQSARQRFRLNVIRMGWDIFARGYSKPIKRTMDEEDLFRLRLWDGEPSCGHDSRLLGYRCRYIVEDVADCYRHLETSHSAIPPIPQMSLFPALRRGMVICTCGIDLAQPKFPCIGTMLALPVVVAKHFASHHPVHCRWLDGMSRCDIPVDPSRKALMEHIATYHRPNLPYDDLAMQDLRPPLYEEACEALSRLPQYERRKRAAEFRIRALLITDMDQINELTREEIHGQLELRSYDDVEVPSIWGLSYEEALQELGKAIQRGHTRTWYT